MAGIAGVGDLVFVGHGGRDKPERMRMDHGSGDAFRLNLWHVACDALAASASCLVMGMLFDGGGVWSVGRCWTVAIEANLVRRFPQLRVIGGAVDVVAGETGDPAT